MKLPDNCNYCISCAKKLSIQMAAINRASICVHCHLRNCSIVYRDGIDSIQLTNTWIGALHKPTCFFLMGLLWPLFLSFRLFYILQLTHKFLRCWDSNLGSLVSEVTALPTVPLPLPHKPTCLSVYY